MNKVILIVLLLILKSSFSQSRKDFQRLQKIIPLKEYYDSITTTTHIFFSITVFNDKVTRCTIGEQTFNFDILNYKGFNRICDSVGLGYSYLLKTIDLMKVAECFEIGNTGFNSGRF